MINVFGSLTDFFIYYFFLTQYILITFSPHITSKSPPLPSHLDLPLFCHLSVNRNRPLRDDTVQYNIKDKTKFNIFK